MDDGRKNPGLDLALAVWSRRKWLAILVFAGPFVAATSIVKFLPDIYGSTATVLIEGQQLPEAFVRSTVTSAVETRLQTITQEILSRSRLESLINRFGLYIELRGKSALEGVIERMRRDIQIDLKGVKQIEQGRATVAFSIGYRGSDPQTVAQVANSLASFYIEENLKARERQAVGTTEFLLVQLEETKKRLDEHERRVSAFKKGHIGELPPQLEANLATLERLNTQLRLNSDTRNRANERRAALAQQLAQADLFEQLGEADFRPAGGPNATAIRIARVKQELTELRTRYTDNYPDVIQKKAEIAALEGELARTKSDVEPNNKEPNKEKTAAVNPFVVQLQRAISEVDAEIAARKAEEQGLRRDINTYQQRVENTPRWEQEFQSLSRDYDTTKELYTSLLKRYEEAKLAESMEQRQKGEQFRILDPAAASEQPVAPNRVRLFLVGLALSLGLALGTVVLAEKLDTSFHTVDELRGFTRFPVLVSIPPLLTEVDASRRRRRIALVALSAMVCLPLIVGSSYLIAKGNAPFVGGFVQSFLLKN
jgi:succinoglycan biosynthesis transport protein ExoP